MTQRFIFLACLYLAASVLACADSSRLNPNAVELQRQGRFVSFSDGTVLDTRNGLMWSSIDFRRNVDWQSAESFCRSFSVGGYNDWRLPSLNELQTLYDERKTDKDGYHITDLIRITGYVWASDFQVLMISVPGNQSVLNDRQLAGYMDFKSGKRDYTEARHKGSKFRILPVRNVE